MSYTQIRQNNLALTRSPNIDPLGQRGGFPAYRAQWTENKTSVLSIVYMDGSGIYLTSDMSFRLSNYNGDLWFSADMSIPGYIPNDITPLQWSDQWANQSNTSPNYNGLILQAEGAGDALTILFNMKVPVSFYRDIPNNQGRNVPWADQGAWIGGVNIYGEAWGEPAAYSWWPTSALHFGSFYITPWKAQWALMPTQTGVTNINSIYNKDRPSVYVGDWEAYGASRWMFTGNTDNILSMDIMGIGGHTYQLVSNGKRLNQGGNWYQVLPHANISNGVEFYNGNDNGIFNLDLMVVEDKGINFSLTDELVYRLGPWVVPMKSQTQEWGVFNPINIPANLPKGGQLCSINVWDGSQLDCYKQTIPYQYDLGSSECSTLDSFSNDTHCQEWGKTNKGESVENRIKALCVSSSYDNPSLCNCFLPDSIYYNRIATEIGETAARGVRATKGLQCESGLCPQDGSLSAQLYYYGGRKCDYCIQVFDLSLTAQEINANINLVQQCASTDASYTWTDLITRLKELGAYQEATKTGQYKDVVISADNSTIYLNSTTLKGKYALQQLPLLQYIPTLDQYKRIIITEPTWRGNITGYSKDITLFLLYIRAPSPQ